MLSLYCLQWPVRSAAPPVHRLRPVRACGGSTRRQWVNLTVTADLKYFVEDLEVPFEQIEPMIARELEKKRDQETIVLLHADKSLNLQDVVNLFDIGNKLKTKMILFTQKDK